MQASTLAETTDVTRKWLEEKHPLTLAAHDWLPECGSVEHLGQKYGTHLEETEGALGYCNGCAGLEECPFPPSLKGRVPTLKRLRASWGDGHERDHEGFVVLELDHVPCRYGLAVMADQRRAGLERDIVLPSRVERILARGADPTEPVKAAVAWADALPEGKINPSGWPSPADITGAQNLILAGPVGRGKTVAVSSALVRAVHRTLLPGRYWTVASMLQALRPQDGGEPKRRVDDLAEIPLLALDDVGVERITDWAQEQLDLLIDARYGAERPTIIGTNLSRKEMEQQLGARIASRILHGARVVTVKGPNLRLGGDADERG